MAKGTPETGRLERPRAVLRVGFAGRRDLSGLSEAQHAQLRAMLARLLGGLAQGLTELVPADPPAHGGVSAWFSRERPLLRLITGLAEGADDLAAQARAGLDPAQTGADTELAAVLPCDVAGYRASRWLDFRATFDRQVQDCAYVLCLDGDCDTPEPDTDLARTRRHKGYRAQSAFLLRQCDLLIAVADPHQPIKPGGTIESLNGALAFGVPVLFVDTRSAEVRRIEPGEDALSALAATPLADDELDARLGVLVRELLANPDRTKVAGDQAQPPTHPAPTPAPRPDEQALLAEYFGGETPRRGWRGWLWSRVERSVGGAGPLPRERELAPYKPYRDRAALLSRRYGGRYRGAFLLGYRLAVVAVLLAVTGLLLLAVAAPAVLPSDAGPAALVHLLVPDALAAPAGGHAPANGAPHAPGWLLPTLLAIALVKFAVLILLWSNTRAANLGRWVERAVDYRYIAERLRTLHYLPLIGSWRPPAPEAPHYATRQQRQSVADWLCDAVIRSVSPAAQEALSAWETIPVDGGARQLRVRVQRPHPARALDRFEQHWLALQVAYHRRNQRTMAHLHHRAEQRVKWLSWAVIGIVAVDIVVLVAETWHLLPQAAALLQGLSALLIFFAATLPAAMASLNGISAQAELARLGDRSRRLAAILGGDGTSVGASRLGQLRELRGEMDKARQIPRQDPGSWGLETLWLTEGIATDCVREVADWAVLYAKPVPEG